MKHNSRRKKSNKETLKARNTKVQLPDKVVLSEKNLDIWIIILLLIFGSYLSILYFGHQVVPNSDFPGFIRVAKSLLSFEIPSNFKRAPVLGFLQIGLSNFTGGVNPYLTAGWLLNAILYPFIIVLFYLIGKRFLGKTAVWFAVISAINPWLLSMLVQPLAEITLLFFILITIYLIFGRSKWCYLFACITTMVRYEGAALIMAAFVIDMIESKSSRQRMLSLLYSVLGSVPLMLWLIGSIISVKHGQSHYFGHYTGEGNALAEYPQYLWEVSVGTLFGSSHENSLFYQITEGSFALGENISKIILIFSVLFAVCYGLYKKQWNILVLLLFLVSFFFVHALRSNTRHRYCVPVFWIVLLLGWYGLKSIWCLINGNNRIPAILVTTWEIILLIAMSAWFLYLFPFLGKLAETQISIRSVSVPYVVMGVLLVIIVLWVLTYRKRYLLRNIALTAVLCLMVTSNQFELVNQLRDGKNNAEFAKLAKWYIENIPGEKLVTSLPSTVKLFVPGSAGKFVHIRYIEAETPEDFVRACYRRKIRYVAWDSRIGFAHGNSYYRSWGINRIAMLARPADNGPYEFITQLKQSDRRYINIFRLREISMPEK